MKILFVFNHPAPYKVRLYNELAKVFDVKVIFERKCAKDREKDFYNVPITCNHTFLKGIDFGNENNCSSGVIKLLKKEKFDLIIMVGYATLTEIRTIHWMIRHHIPYLLYVNGGFVRKEGNFKRKFKEKLIKNAKYYFSPSLATDDYLVYYGARREDIYHYPYSTIFNSDVLDTPLSLEEKIAERKQKNLPLKNLFVSVGSFTPVKNLAKLIENWKYVNKDYNLILIGGGPEKEQYAQLIKHFGLKNVYLFDFMKREVLFNYLSAMDAFIFYTKGDIYGHVVNEALAKGLPVISTPYSNATKKLVKDDYNGCVVDSEKESLVMATTKVLNDEEFQKHALEIARKNTTEEMINAHIKILKEIEERK